MADDTWIKGHRPIANGRQGSVCLTCESDWPCRVETLAIALRYISQPTMAYPGGDIDKFVRETAREQDVRGALATCIFMARKALEG